MFDKELERIWDGILSRDPETIRTTYLSLDQASKGVVLQHLERMATEDGWHPGQVASAQAALNAIKENQG